MKNYIKPELLSPAGSYEALVAAVHAGCNAVYLGGEKFGARANAVNFTNEYLPKAIDFAHLHDVKVYYTANTLIKDSELSSFIEQVNFLYKEGIDGLILQDIGAFHLVKQYFPNLDLHASTQMTVHSLSGAKFLEQMGFERVVLSRELSLNEIESIIKGTNVEIECFIHGALCYSYSGQCLFSSLIGGRSGNRGTCAQPCRLPYELLDAEQREIYTNGNYLLSPKDIQTLEVLPQLIKSGIHSLKIEGRMKNANYVGLVTSVYRKYIDLFFERPNQYKVDETDLLQLSQIYNRGGFSNGCFFNKNGLQMMSTTRPNHQGVLVGRVEKSERKSVLLLFSEDIHQGDCLEINGKNESYSFTIKEDIKVGHHKMNLPEVFNKGDLIYRLMDVKLAENIEKNILKMDNKLKVELKFTAHLGQPCEIILTYREITVKIQGEIVESAKTSAMNEEKVCNQLSKTGNDPLIFINMDLNLDSNIFLSVKEINRLRREAIEILLSQILKASKRNSIEAIYEHKPSVFNRTEESKISVLVRNKSQFGIVKEYSIDNIYFELTGFEKETIEGMVNICRKKGIKTYIALPRIIRQTHLKYIQEYLEEIKQYSINGVMIRTPDAYPLVDGFNEIIVDYTFNIYNNEAIDFWQNKSIKKITVSQELNSKELSRLKSGSLETVIYGFLPIMVTAQCVHQWEKNACQRPSDKPLYLKDRKKMNFKVFRDCKMCLNTIYNALPVVLIDKYKELQSNSIYRYRLEFLDEPAEDIKSIMSYVEKIKNKTPLTAEDLELINPLRNYTRGHYNRGVK